MLNLDSHFTHLCLDGLGSNIPKFELYSRSFSEWSIFLSITSMRSCSIFSLCHLIFWLFSEGVFQHSCLSIVGLTRQDRKSVLFMHYFLQDRKSVLFMHYFLLERSQLGTIVISFCVMNSKFKFWLIRFIQF